MRTASTGSIGATASSRCQPSNINSATDHLRMLIGDESEAHFMNRIRRRAKLLGWEDFHQQDSMGTRAGLPDLILVRPPRVIFAELKSEHGRLTRAQRHTLANLMGCPGGGDHIWEAQGKDSDWEIFGWQGGVTEGRDGRRGWHGLSHIRLLGDIPRRFTWRSC